MNLFRRIRAALTGRGTETFCETCGSVCDASCRAAAIHERALAVRTHVL